MDAIREKIIVAMTADGVIGTAAGLPWRLPEELRQFRDLTWGATLVMGRATYESIGRPLPGRRTLVVSSSLLPQAGITVCSDFAGAVCTALRHPEPVFYIGGRSVYAQALPRVAELWISWVKGQYHGAVRFPHWEPADWDLLDCADHPDFTFCRYRRRALRPPVSGPCPP